MKKLLIIFLILIHYSITTNASEVKNTSTIEIENKVDWENIVDYVNAKITLFYISEQIEKGNIKSNEETKDFENFNSRLDNSNLREIIPFNDLKNLLEPHFGKTLENISSPINSLKLSNDLNTESLFASVKSILTERQSDVQNSEDFIKLEDFIISFVEENEVVVTAETRETKNSNEDKTGENKFISYSTLLFLAIFLFLTTVIFVIGWLHVRRINHKNENIISEMSKKPKVQKWEEKYPTANMTRTETRTRNTINQNLKPGIKATENKPKNIQIEEQKSPEIELSLPTITPEKKHDHLYAGKPTEDKILKEISSELDPQQTIFKLVILPNNSEVAEFEVLHVSNFMTRSITNSPDDYLYRVCNHENSNQEFKKEIITVKKGIANLVDGEWKVKDKNKATIKFQ